ncbi:uncharacterized protein LOC111691374 [Anoplophora glabripennis]|uniref:uncharacterized protein LOC111691374 n=1 Tax=Anoplophora glabripennis TaxID=217634 RepID=UPI000C76403D|nr:uncharacterized protein LOC111691374 [Anoplophora glabripennis]
MFEYEPKPKRRNRMAHLSLSKAQKTKEWSTNSLCLKARQSINTFTERFLKDYDKGHEFVVQFRLLNLKIEALNCEDVENEHDFDRNVRGLKSMIQYQQYLMRYVKDLNELLYVPLALMMITSVFLMCLNMYTLTTSEGTMVDSGRVMLTSFALVVEFLIVYGLSAQLLMDESEATADMIYFECEWYLPNLRPLRKYFLIMMTRSQKDVCIRAGNYHMINNRTILVIMRTAYSFYTFLQKVAYVKE